MPLVSDWAKWFATLAPGLLVSIELTALCLLLGLPFGLLLAVMIESRYLPLRGIAFVFVEVGRGAPALVLLYMLYYGLAESGVTLRALVVAVISLGWNTGAYTSELFRAGIGAVPRGQREAATACGLSGWTGFQHIILPQALRISVPPLASFSIILFQASSLAFVIAVPEMMSRAYELGAATFEYLSIFCLTAVMYGVVTIIALGFVRLAEQRLGRHI
jgi:polar amino acid transport system permease protein